MSSRLWNRQRAGRQKEFTGRLWLKERDRVPPDQLRVLRLLVPVPVAGSGFMLLSYGLVRLEVWPTVFGASLIVLAQLWRIDRLVVFYDSTR
jgi:hypothetical protein